MERVAVHARFASEVASSARLERLEAMALL